MVRPFSVCQQHIQLQEPDSSVGATKLGSCLDESKHALMTEHCTNAKRSVRSEEGMLHICPAVRLHVAKGGETTEMTDLHELKAAKPFKSYCQILQGHTYVAHLSGSEVACRQKGRGCQGIDPVFAPELVQQAGVEAAFEVANVQAIV